MDNLEYLDFVKNKLIEIGLDDSYLEQYAVNILKNASERGIPIVDILDKGLSKDLINSNTIDLINEVRSPSSYISVRKFNPEPNKFIRRNIIL